MSRATYVMRDGELVDVSTLPRVSVPRGPILIRDYGAYDCPVTGKIVEGRHAHAENLKQHGCRLLEKGESRDQTKRVRENTDAELSRILDKAEATMAAAGE